MDARQPAFPRGKEEEETRDGLLAERGERRKRKSRGGAIKTLTSNLVYCVKKSHMHSRPREGPHAPVWPWWTLAPGLVPSFPGPSGAAAAAGAVAGPSAGLLEPLWREGGWTAV